MGRIRLTGATSGYTELRAASTAGNNTITLPTTNGGEVVVSDSSGNVNIDSGTFYIDAANNRVGVGTASPNTKLTVEGASGSTLFAVASPAGNGVLIAPYDSSAIYQLAYASNSISYVLGTQSNIPLALFTNNTERVRIDSSGRLLVGTSTASGSSLLQVASGINDSIGNVRDIPQNAQTSSYTLVASDSGKHVDITTGGVTVPSGVFSVGNVVTIFNDSSSNQTITQGASVTLRQAGTANTGNRTLAQYGIATILCVGSNTFVISGAGLS